MRVNRPNQNLLFRRLRLFALLIIAIVLAVFFLLRALNSPAEGTVSAPKLSSLPAAQKKPHIYIGKNISFAYPAAYRVVSAKASTGYLEGVNLYATDLSSKQISVAVAQETLDQDSGVLLRKAHPETYHLESTSPTKLVFTEKTAGSYEIAQFENHAGMVTSIDISCPYERDLKPDFDQVSTSFKWR
jgi:hypothetical protein